MGIPWLIVQMPGILLLSFILDSCICHGLERPILKFKWQIRSFLVMAMAQSVGVRFQVQDLYHDTGCIEQHRFLNLRWTRGAIEIQSPSVIIINMVIVYFRFTPLLWPPIIFVIYLFIYGVLRSRDKCRYLYYTNMDCITALQRKFTGLLLISSNIYIINTVLQFYTTS